MPPRLIRTILRPSASAIDWPKLVLPTPGGPRKQRIGPCPCGWSLCKARHSFSRRHDLGRWFGRFQASSQLLTLLVHARVALTQFPLDRLDLLAQIGPALCIRKLRLHIFLKFLLNLSDLELR